MLLQKTQARRIGERVGTRFEGVPEWAVGIDLQPRPVLQPLVMTSSEREGLRRRPGKGVEERLQELGVEALTLGELPEDRSEAGTEGEDPDAKKFASACSTFRSRSM